MDTCTSNERNMQILYNSSIENDLSESGHFRSGMTREMRNVNENSC